ncbi:hypothetical protein BD410DRAFT_793723 [Rickenella mellea]|uniref:Uncharacterized protein n=1 Tax=Rickenella mellea TaxID=50990 RepID=A0A4Y7PSI2_9AGAM|nr:hypothetical protein BD410DRAFT_793723 [Rickenella mellea]
MLVSAFPEPVGSASRSGSGSVRSGNLLHQFRRPTSAPVRPLDEDYDKGIADTSTSRARPIEHPPAPADSVHRAERRIVWLAVDQPRH